MCVCACTKTQRESENQMQKIEKPFVRSGLAGLHANKQMGARVDMSEHIRTCKTQISVCGCGCVHVHKMKPLFHERGMTISLSGDACCWKWWIMSFFLTLSSACKSKTHSLRSPVNITPLHIIAPLMLCCWCRRRRRRRRPQHPSMWCMYVFLKKNLLWGKLGVTKAKTIYSKKILAQISWRILSLEWKTIWK